MVGSWGRGSARETVVGPSRPLGVDQAPAVLWVPDDDLRLLLRGILTLQHHPVALELTSAEALHRWEPPPVALLIVDAASGAERWREELADALATRPELRAIVLLPRGQQNLEHEAEALGARATLARPFGIKDLVEAIHRALHGPATPTGG
jgi:DNA-binding NarL/FixJ family response regulator